MFIASFSQCLTEDDLSFLLFLLTFWDKAMMDTAQRALLEISYEAFRGAGFSARLPDGQLRGIAELLSC